MFKLDLSLGFKAYKQLVSPLTYSNVYALISDAKDSVGTADGVVYGGLEFVEDIDLGFCPNFTGDGSKFISMGDNLDLGVASCGFSIWIKMDVYPPTSSGTIFAKSLYGSVPNRFYLQSYGRNFAFTIVDNNKVTYVVSTANIYLAVGLMHIYVDINRSGFLSIYVNSVKQSSTKDLTPMKGQDISNNFPLVIGKYNDNLGGLTSSFSAISAKLSLLKKHSISRSENEIIALYQSEKNAKGII